MKANKLRLLSLAGLAASAIAVGSPALAHDGYPYARAYFGAPHCFRLGHRVVVVQPPLVVYRPEPIYYVSAPVYDPAPVYYAPAAPVYYSLPAAATIAGAIAGAAIGSIASNGRPGATAAGTVIGAVVGNGLAR
jgi:hypothetical protein